MLFIIAATLISQFSGKAVDENNNFIFTETCQIEREGERVLRVTTTYTAPDGNPIATLTSDFDTDPHLPKMHYTRSALQYGLTPSGPWLQLYRETKKALEAKEVKAVPKMVAGHGFYFFILDHLDSLLTGKREVIHLVQPDRLTSHTFRIRASLDPLNGERAIVTMDLKNPLLRSLIPPIILTIDRKEKTLLSYTGIDGFAMVVSKRYPITIHYSPPKQM